MKALVSHLLQKIAILIPIFPKKLRFRYRSR